MAAAICFSAGSRNFLRFQTGAEGEGALAIDFVLEELVNQLLTGMRGYFSAYLYVFDQPAFHSGLPRMGENTFVIGETFVDPRESEDSIAEAVLNAATDRPSVWDRALGTSLADLEPTEDPRQALNCLASSISVHRRQLELCTHCLSQ